MLNNSNVVRVGTFYDAPLSYGTKENFFTKPKALATEFLYAYCETQNVNCDFQESPDDQYGYFNGTWQGMVKHIHDGMFELSFPMFTPSSQRFEEIDFSIPIAYIPLLLVTRNPKLSAISIDLLSPFVFDWSVWVLLVVFSTLIGIFVALSETPILSGSFCYKLFSNCIDVFSLITNQGGLLIVPRLSIRFMVAFWVLSIVILSGVYSGQLVQSLINNNVSKLPFHDFLSFIECIEKRKCRLVLPDSQLSFVTEVYDSDSDLYKRLRKALLRNKLAKTGTIKELLDFIDADKRYYSVAIMSHIDFLVGSNHEKHCSYSWVQYDVEVEAFPYGKNATFKEKLNMFVHRVNEAGLFQKYYSKLFGKEKDCKINDFDRNLLHINIIQFIGCLFVYFVGLFISSVVLCVEYVKYKLQ